jgi:hypothetical protein
MQKKGVMEKIIRSHKCYQKWKEEVEQFDHIKFNYDNSHVDNPQSMLCFFKFCNTC